MLEYCLLLLAVLSLPAVVSITRWEAVVITPANSANTIGPTPHNGGQEGATKAPSLPLPRMNDPTTYHPLICQNGTVTTATILGISLSEIKIFIRTDTEPS